MASWVDSKDSLGGRARSHSTARGHARPVVEGVPGGQAPGMRARTPGPHSPDVELEAEILELETALINGLRADSAEATRRAIARLVAYREKEYGE